MKRQFFLLSIALLSGFRGLAQSDDPINNGLPTARSTSGGSSTGAGSGLVNVNHFTGTANVTIPIYDYKIAGLDLGISLSYNTSGIRVDQTASEVGLGWNLNAGGSIKRIVHGIEDDQVLPQLGSPEGNLGNYVQTYRGRNAGCWDGGCDDDTEYDLYEANFCGSSIRFTLASDGYAAFQPINTDPKGTYSLSLYFLDSAGKIKGYNYSPGDEFGTKFQYASKHPLSLAICIMNDKGDYFHFKRGDYSNKLYKVPNLPQDPNDPPGTLYEYSYYPTESWVLYKIETHSRDTVFFDYREYDDVSYVTGHDETIHEFTTSCNVPGAYAWANNQYPELTRVDSFTSFRGGISQLERIRYSNGVQVRFVAGVNGKRRCDMPALAAIDSIIVVSGYGPADSNRLCYRLNYSYQLSPGDSVTTTVNTGNSRVLSMQYSSPCSNLNSVYPTGGFGNLFPSLNAFYGNLYTRLRLEAIDVLNSSRTKSELYYKFGYNSIPLPNRLNTAQDHYGYFNGKFTNKLNFRFSGNDSVAYAGFQYSAVPLHTFTLPNSLTITYGADKMSDANYATASNLVTVENGLRGKVQLFYKPHVLSNPQNWYVPDMYETVALHPHSLRTDMQCANVNDGLCIDQVIYSDGYQQNNSTSKKYVFEDGFRIFQGGYYWYPLAVAEQYHPDSMPTTLNRVYKNTNVQRQDYISGANHGYQTVYEESYNHIGTLLGSTKYTFTGLFNSAGKSNLSLYFGPWANTYYPRYFEKYRVGKPKEKQVFGLNNVTTSRDIYSYPPVNNSTVALAQLSRINETKIFIPYSSTSFSKTMSPRFEGYLVSFDVHPDTIERHRYIGSNDQVSKTSYIYDSRGSIVNESTTESNGFIRTKSNIWSYNYTSASYPSPQWLYARLTLLINSNVSSEVRQSALSIGRSGSNQAGFNWVNAVQSLKMDGLMHTDWQIFSRDGRNNVTEKVTGETDTSAFIWDMRIGKCIASASNAHYNDIAYSSFEGGYDGYTAFGSVDGNKGNWDFRHSSVQKVSPGGVSKTMTGKYYYQLDPASQTNVVDPQMLETRNELPDGKKYVLTFWSTGTPQVLAAGPGALWSIPVPITQAKQVGGWNLYTATFSARGGKLFFINAGSSPMAIDELRLFPKGSTMTTSTYTPIFGVTSQTDNFNNIKSFEYDDFGKLVTTRNTEGNILSITRSFTQSADY